jgi:DNA gyrase subunit A
MRAGKGKALVNLLAFEPGEKMAEIVAIRDFEQEQHLLFATRKGRIKRTPLGEFRNIYSRGLRAINLVDGDDLIAVAVVDGGGPVVEDDAGLEEVEAIEPEGAESEGGEGEAELTEDQLKGDFDEPRVLLATSAGRTICFALSQVRPMGRASQGVKGVSLRGDAVVVGLEVVRQRGVEVLTVASNGHGKRTQILRYPVKKRAGMGVMDIDVKGSGGSVVGVSQVTEADGLLFITNNGAVIRILARDIRRTGRNTKGVRIIQLGDGDRLVGVTRIEGDAEEQESGAEVAAQGELLDMVGESNQGAPAPEGV